MALGMAAVILAFEYRADDSVINLVYKVAGCTYGLILDVRSSTLKCDRWIPLVAASGPVPMGHQTVSNS